MRNKCQCIRKSANFMLVFFSFFCLFICSWFLSVVSSSSSSSTLSSHSEPPTYFRATPATFKHVEDYDFPYCILTDKYEKMVKIGHGTFGEVFKAREISSGRKFVAMKKVLMDNEKEGVSLIYSSKNCYSFTASR